MFVLLLYLSDILNITFLCLPRAVKSCWYPMTAFKYDYSFDSQTRYINQESSLLICVIHFCTEYNNNFCKLSWIQFSWESINYTLSYYRTVSVTCSSDTLFHFRVCINASCRTVSRASTNWANWPVKNSSIWGSQTPKCEPASWLWHNLYNLWLCTLVTVGFCNFTLRIHSNY